MLDGELLLDGSTCGSLASFVNHSCTPNCSLQIWMVPVSAGKYELLVGIFSLELIGKGVPLTIDYLMMSIILFGIQCFCRSTNCKEYIDRARYSVGKKVGAQQARTRARVAARDAETKPYLVDKFLQNDPGTGTESQLDLLNSYVLVMNLFQADMQNPNEDT